MFAKSVAAVTPVARKAGVPVIAFSNDRQVAGSGVYLLSFQPAPEVERVVAYAASQGKRRYAALISQDAFGKIVEPVFRDAVSRNGGTVVALETYHPGSANAMLEPLRKISAAIAAAEADGGPVDALFVPGGQEQLETVGTAAAPGPDQHAAGQADRHRRHGLSQRRARFRLGRRVVSGARPPRLDRFCPEVRQELRPRTAAHCQPGLRCGDAGHRAWQAVPEGQRYTPATITRPSGFTGIDGAYRLLADGTADRSLAILEVQQFGATIVETAPSAPKPAPAAVSGTNFSIFNFLNQ